MCGFCSTKLYSTSVIAEQEYCTLYSIDGQSITVTENDKEIYLNNGWYLEPMIKLYGVGDKETLVPVSQKETYLQTGDWSETIWGYVNINYNVFQKTNLSPNTLNKILEGTHLSGCGTYFFNMEQTYGVNAVFAIAVAENESGLGKHNANKNNFWGRKAISGGWMSWATKEASIMDFGAYIKRRYSNMTIDQIGPIYCPYPGGWAGRTRSFMEKRFNKI